MPDDFGDRPIDLRAYYGSISRRYWLLFLAQRGVATGTAVWAWSTMSDARLAQFQLAWLGMPVALPLVFIRNRWWQGLGLVAVAILSVGPHIGQTLAH